MSNPGAASSILANSMAVMDGLRLLFVLQGANLALGSQDQQFTRAFQGITWDPQFITAVWTSGAASGAPAGGLFTLPGKGGSAIVATSQSYGGLTGAFTHVNCTVQASTTTFTTTPYLNLTTANGAALTADFRIYGFSYD